MDSLRLATLEDALEIQRILDEPSVAAGALIHKDSQMTARAWLEQGGLALMAEGGCFLLMPLSPTQMDVHTLFLPGYRGKKAFLAAKQGLLQLFTGTDIQEVFTKVSKDNKPVMLFTGSVGFTRLCEDAQFVYYHLTLSDWLANAPGLREKGEAFHAALPEEHVSHEDELIHNQAVGFTSICIHNGFIFKGISTYNVWAYRHGWQELKIVSLDPLRIDMGECIISVSGDSFEVEQYQK